MDNKIKEKIEKLLNLSLSDNEHEASIALQRALALMNDHNITEEQVRGQQMISSIIELSFYRTPDWAVTLYDSMSRVSGCVLTYRNGWKGFSPKKAIVRITGRERDVANATYLSQFLYRELEKAAKKFQKEMKGRYRSSTLALLVKSFKIGFIERVYRRLEEQQNSFFNEQSKGTDLICVDTKSRRKDAQDYFSLTLGETNTSKSQAKYHAQGVNEGASKADKLEINQAVSGQKSIKQLGAYDE